MNGPELRRGTGYWGLAQAGIRGTARAGRCGTAIAGYRGTAQVGDGGHAQAGEGGRILIEWHDGERYRTAVGYVGEDGILADTLYRCDDEGNLIPVEN